jgi:hypothetical protein
MTITISRADQGQSCQSSAPNPNHRKPCGIDPVEWAHYNASQARSLAEISGLPPSEAGVLDSEMYETAQGPLDDLLRAVRRAASELERTSEKGDRVSLQLLTAMARFHAEVEAP